MRFRAQLRQIRLLVQALNALARVSKGEVVWKLSERRLMIVTGGSGSGNVQAVCTINTAQVMEAMRIDSKQANQIYLRVDLPSLLRILRPAERSRDVTMKLSICRTTRRPILQFQMTVKSALSSYAQTIVQELPVAVLSEEEVGDLMVPDTSSIGDSVSLFLPPLSDVRPFAEKMSKITDRLQIVASVFHTDQGDVLPHGGVLELRTQTPHFSAATQYKNLPTSRSVCDATPAAGTAGSSTPSHRTESCVVDAKKLLSVLEVEKIVPSQVLIHIPSQDQLVVHATANGELAVLFQVPGLT